MTGSPPLPLSELGPEDARRVKVIFSDLDDTISLHGRVVPQAFEALARARESGIRTVLITGRPAGWVDLLARMWPVDGVVGENGGLWFWHDGVKLQRRFLQPLHERARNRERLAALAENIPRRVPGCAVSVDQPYRELDLAIDFCEDVPPLDDRAIDQIVLAFEEAGATCKVSSIHVNGWYGDFDKLEGCRRFVREVWAQDMDQEMPSYLYFGDSGNDEPMFRAFPYTVGVANVVKFLPRLTYRPRWITQGEGGIGFAQAVERVLALRRA